MISAVKKMRNYITQNLQAGNTIDKEHIEWLQNKIDEIQEEYMKLSDKVFQAETKEKLGIERQKQFGISQTKVEDSRHDHIMSEIQALRDAGITSFNRSSYPFLPRHKQGKGHSKFGKAGKENPETKQIRKDQVEEKKKDGHQSQ